MRRIAWLVCALLLAGCASNPDRYTLADLRLVEPQLDEIDVGDSLERAMAVLARYSR